MRSAHTERHVIDHSCGNNARHRSNTFERAVKEVDLLRHLRELRPRDGRGEGQYATRFESRIDGAQDLEAAYHQSRSNQQHQGERNFYDDESAASAIAAGITVGTTQALF